MFKRKIFITTLITILSLIFFSSSINAIEIEKGDYSKRYEEWLKLSDDEKKDTIAPLPFNVRNERRSVFNVLKNTLKATQIPENYDLRDHITVEVKNQMNTGQCWAFTANTSLETYLALNGEIYNFSERHLDYVTASNFIDGINEYALNRFVGDGGYASTAFTYYSRGSGPILEEDMPFENNEYSISINDLPEKANVKKVDNMIFFSNIYKNREDGILKYVDANNIEYTQVEINEIRNQIKEHIMNYGAISADVYAPSYYYNEETYSDNLCENAYSNHAVTIIGWDDNYSKENFINKPSEDGAYIVLNSWGTEWGDNGVYYVSYEDFLIESQMRGVTSVSDLEYDNLYQYDISEMWNCIESPYAANVFTAKADEKLTEIMVGSLSEQTCDVYINTTGSGLNISNLTKVASNVKLVPGYNTIEINSDILIASGNEFAVVVKLTNSDYTGIGIEDNNEVYFGNAKSNLGESFVSEDGINWSDIYDENNMMNLSIKAYTQTEESSVEIIDIEYPNKLLFENLGGDVNLKLKTTRDYEGYQFDVLIYDELENNITSQFDFEMNPIKDTQGRVKVNVTNTIEAGNYLIKIIDDTTIVAEASLVVSQQQYDTDTYMKVKLNDENLYNALKNNVLLEHEIYAYFDNTQELIVRRDIETIDLEGNAYNEEGRVRFGSGYNVRDLTGLENFSNLKNLNLSANPIEDLKPIENLTNLENLQLYYGLMIFSGIDYNNEIKNVYVIGNLTNLYRLDITNCKLEDISFLANLNNLVSLDLQQNQISDISPLKNLTNLSYLSLGSNNISNIGDLSNLTNLNTLILQDNLITDISAIENLTNLNKLWLNINKITDASILDNDMFYKDSQYRLSLDISNNYMYEEIYITENDIIIKEVPEIIKQVLNENSVLFSEEGVNLVNCEWNEYGKSIKINTENNLSRCSIEVKSGLAINTIFEITLSNGIRIKNAPIKTEYIEGENFDETGMVVEIINENGEYEETTSYTVINGTNLIEGQEYVIIRSIENPEIEVKQEIFVGAKQEIGDIEDLFDKIYIEFPDINLYNAIKSKTPFGGYGIEFECFDDENKIYISKNDIEFITYLDLSSMDIIDITGIEKFTNLQTINLGYNYNLENVDALSLLPQIKCIILNGTKVENIETLINKESVEEIIIYNENLQVYNNKEEKIELPRYIYQSLKLQEGVTATAVIYYDVLDTTRGGGGDFPINDYNNFEIVNINLDDEKEVAMIELDRRITNEKKKGIRAIVVTIEGGKTLDSEYRCYYEVKKELIRIEVNGYTADNYYFIEGQDFNRNGLQVVAIYNDGSSQEITDYRVIDGEDLKLTQQSVTISYTEDGITKTTTQEIMVQSKSLEKIEIKNEPTNTSYYIGETLNTEGLVILATYNNGTTEDITEGFECTPMQLNTAGTQTITVTYKGKETSFTVTVLEIEEEKLEINIQEYQQETDGDNNYINNINPESKIEEVLQKIQANINARKGVYKETTLITNLNEKIATGMKIVVSLNSQVAEYIVVVSGDINGDGQITATDLTRMKNHILEKSTLTDLAFKAADLNNDGRITATELTKIKKYILGFNIQLH